MDTKPFARLAAVVALAAPLAACIYPTMYNDNLLHEIAPGQYPHIAAPRPVQLLFDFQINETPNAKARDQARAIVDGVIRDSALFSVVGADAQPNGAILRVTVDDQPFRSNVYNAPLVGPAFGVRTTTVGDDYVCTVRYDAGSGAAPVSKDVHDAIYAAFGANPPAPPHADRAEDAQAAVGRMVRKCVGNALVLLARDPAFVR